MSLSLSSILHYWSARDGVMPLVGGRPTHSRNSAAKVRDSSDLYYDAIINTPRFQPEADKSTTANERRMMLLLEQGRTNSCLWSRDLTNAAWTRTGTGSAALNAVGLDGSANSATALTDSDAASTTAWYQSATVANDGATHVVRAWIAKDSVASRMVAVELDLLGGTTTKSHRVDLNTSTGASANVVAGGGGTARVLDDGLWWIVEVALTNNTTGNVTLRWFVYASVGAVLGTASNATTGSCVVGNVNVELGQSVGSAPIFTTSAAVTRSVDNFNWSYQPAPQALFTYLRFVERGTVSGQRLISIASAAEATPQLLLFNSGGNYSAYHHNGTAAVQVTLGAAPAIGDTVELLLLLNSAGAIELVQSINGAAVTNTAASANNTLAAAWSDTKLWLNSGGSANVALGTYADVRIVKYADVAAVTEANMMSELRAFELDRARNLL